MNDTTATERIRFMLDDSPTGYPEGANAEPLPEPQDFFEQNPIMRDGATVDYAEYLRTTGNPDNYYPYRIVAERKCSCCGQWEIIGQVWDWLYDDGTLPRDGATYTDDDQLMRDYGMSVDDLRGMNVHESDDNPEGR